MLKSCLFSVSSGSKASTLLSRTTKVREKLRRILTCNQSKNVSNKQNTYSKRSSDIWCSSQIRQCETSLTKVVDFERFCKIWKFCAYFDLISRRGVYFDLCQFCRFRSIQSELSNWIDFIIFKGFDDFGQLCLFRSILLYDFSQFVYFSQLCWFRSI